MCPRLLARMANARHRIQGGSSWNATRFLPLYPALVLLYAGGLSAIAAKNYGLFRSLLLDVKVKIDINTQMSSGDTLTPWQVLSTGVARKLPGLNSFTALNDHL